MLKKSDLTRVSKRMTYFLRHAPEDGDLVLDSAGWTSLSDLVRALRNVGCDVTAADVHDIVAADEKGRFSIEIGVNKHHERIRANQGHSVELEMDFQQAEPPVTLFHGTVQRFVDHIFRDGLLKMARHHVHLSADIETATSVGSRRGNPVILVVDAAAMRGEGIPFWRSANGVWLVDAVPPKFLHRL